MQRLIVTVLCALWTVGAAAAGFTGQIVDAEGRPQAGVQLSTKWLFFDPTVAPDKIEPADDVTGLTTDEQGRFTIPDADERQDWLAIDAARTHGVLIPGERQKGDGVAFILAPLTPVRGHYEIEAEGSIPESIGTWARRRLGRNPIAFCESWSEQFGFKLPSAEYALFHSNGDLDHRVQLSLSTLFDIEPDAALIELEKIHLELPQVIGIKGRVLGTDGEPAEGIEVDRMWNADESGITGMSPEITGASGAFSRREGLYGKQILLTAFDAERRLGGMAVIGEGQSQVDVTIRLEPLIEVTAAMRLKESDTAPLDAAVAVTTRDTHLTVAYIRRADGNISVKLPPGEYAFFYYGTGAESRAIDVTLVAEKSPRHDLGRVVMKPDLLTRKAGKRAPGLHVTEARGIDPDFNLADLRGRWVAIEFWGYWCGPCVRDGLPRLTRLYKKHAAKRDKFEVLAFHDTTAESLRELDELTNDMVEQLWNNEPLPYPVLIDATGKTLRRYGIQGFPTLVLIDPEGRLVPGGNELEFERILNEL